MYGQHEPHARLSIHILFFALSADSVLLLLLEQIAYLGEQHLFLGGSGSRGRSLLLLAFELIDGLDGYKYAESHRSEERRVGKECRL